MFLTLMYKNVTVLLLYLHFCRFWKTLSVLLLHTHEGGAQKNTGERSPTRLLCHGYLFIALIYTPLTEVFDGKTSPLRILNPLSDELFQPA